MSGLVTELRELTDAWASEASEDETRQAVAEVRSVVDRAGIRGGTTADLSRGTRTPEGLTMLPLTATTLDEARSKLSGLHFAKESLSSGEREILYLAEGLLRLLDEEDPRGYRR